MPGFRIQAFEGEVPRLAGHLLPDNAARVATNVSLANGDLNPIKGPLWATTLGDMGALGVGRSLFRLRARENSLWLAWGRAVSAVPGPIAGDTTGRTYYTGDAEPRVTDYALAATGPSGAYPRSKYALGVPHPGRAPSLAGGGGGVAPNINRAYVTTFVTQWGEESAPSDAGSITIQTGENVILSNMGAAPPNSGDITALTYVGNTVTITTTAAAVNRVGDEITVAGVSTVANVNGTWVLTGVNETSKTMAFRVDVTPTGTYNNTIDNADTWARVAPWNTAGLKRRIYRTQAGSSATEYQLVVEIPASDATYVDSKTDNQLEADLLPSMEWDLPPADLKSLVALPSGALAGISGNQLCFSEPYRPHAWPPAYRRTMAYPGVALGVFGTTLVAGTTGNPYIAQGVDPATVSLTMAGAEFPCVSARGMVSMDSGVLYPSHEGLVSVGLGGTGLASVPLFSRDEWQAIGPANLFATGHAGRYYGVYLDDAGRSRMFILDPHAKIVRSDIDCTALFSDPVDGGLYFIDGNQVYRWGADVGMRMFMDWLSKRFIVPTPLTMTAAEVIADFSMTEAEEAALLAARQLVINANALLLAADVGGSMNSESLLAGSYEINGDALAYPPELRFESLSFQLLVDGQVKYTKQIERDTRAFSMPSGYRATEFAVRLTGNVRVNSVAIASNRLGLKQV